jgi:hypothetical protein
MFKRFLNIALIFTLLLSVIGVSTTKTYCTMMKTVMTESCCDNLCSADMNMDGCCQEITDTYKLDTDLSSVNASIELPDITLFAIAFISTFESALTVLEKSHSYSTYSPPRITTDIPVLIQVFRI